MRFYHDYIILFGKLKKTIEVEFHFLILKKPNINITTISKKKKKKDIAVAKNVKQLFIYFSQKVCRKFEKNCKESFVSPE